MPPDLARGDVVVVTVNHRLNAFGYLYLAELGGPDLKDSGNAGMLDLVLALQWVRNNIAEFGGDPNRVTIFGHSGGGAKCATLMAMPAARGLFHGVITQSGQQVTASRRETATKHARQLLDALKLSPDRIDELRTMPTRNYDVFPDGRFVLVKRRFASSRPRELVVLDGWTSLEPARARN